jgi:hypothetical protein
MISKERFKQIVLGLMDKADDAADEILMCKGEFHDNWHTVRDTWFAHALIKAVEAESEVVAWGIESEEQFFFGKKDKRPFAKAWKPYLALPLVEESK